MANELVQGLFQSLLAPQQTQQNDPTAIMAAINSSNPMAAAMAYNLGSTGQVTKGLLGQISGGRLSTATPQEAMQRIMTEQPTLLQTSQGIQQLAQMAQQAGDRPTALKLALLSQQKAEEEANKERADRIAALEEERLKAQTAREIAETPTTEDMEAQRALRQAQAAEVAARTANMPAELQLRQDTLAAQRQRIEADMAAIKAQSEELDVRTKDRINVASEEALASYNNASNLMRIASVWEAEKPTPGFLGTMKSTVENFFGTQGGMEEARAQYNQVLMSGVASSLPRGPASDKDVQLALKGWLSDYSNPETVASFMRGMAKLSAIAAERDVQKAEYIRKNGTQAGFLDTWLEKTQSDGFEATIANKYGLTFGEAATVSDEAARAALSRRRSSGSTTPLPQNFGNRMPD